MNPAIAISRIDLRGKKLSKAQYKRAIPRAALDVARAMELIAPILDRVENGSEETLRELAF